MQMNPLIGPELNAKAAQAIWLEWQGKDISD